MARAVRAASLLLTALVVPACNWSFTTDSPPPASGSNPFVLQIPLNGQTVVFTSPQFAWTALGGAVSYRLQVSTASDFSQIIWDQPNIAVTSIFLQPSLTYSSQYWWRVYGVLGGGGMVLAGGSPYEFFTQMPPNGLPAAFLMTYPGSGATGIPRTPTFVWDPTGATSYRVRVDIDPAFPSPTLVDVANIRVNQVLCPLTLAANQDYYWTVTAFNPDGSRVGSGSPVKFKTGP